MPEGPELRLSGNLIKPLVLNHKVIRADPSMNGRYGKVTEKIDNLFEFSVEGLFDFNMGSYMSSNPSYFRVLDINTKGKFMYWSFTNDWYMYCTYGMTGQWSPKEGKHVCFTLDLEDDNNKQSKLYFNDPRHFGTIKFVKGKDQLDKKLRTLGWDPLQDNLNSYRNLIERKLNSNKPIGQLLMDQSIFAGVGNYIRAEALYAAKISPWRPGNKLMYNEISNLCESIIAVMQQSYDYQGATLHTYTNVYGEEGNYSSFFKVYGNKTDPLGNVVKTEATPEGRTIHWCPDIQK